MDGTTERNRCLTVIASFEHSRLEPELLTKAYGLIVSRSDLLDDRHQCVDGTGNLRKELEK
jgi:hypothetical protein